MIGGLAGSFGMGEWWRDVIHVQLKVVGLTEQSTCPDRIIGASHKTLLFHKLRMLMSIRKNDSDDKSVSFGFQGSGVQSSRRMRDCKGDGLLDQATGSFTTRLGRQAIRMTPSQDIWSKMKSI